MYKTKNVRQKIYDKWHKDVYQTDIEKSMESFKTLHKTAIQCLGIGKDSKGKLLDVACGKGILLKAIRNMNDRLQLYGTDISPFAVAKAKKIVDATFSVDDGEDLSFSDNMFDYVSCLGGLEYYQNPAQGAKEIHRVLKRNGTAVIFVPNLMFAGYMWLALRHGIMPTHGGMSKSGKKIYDYNDERFYTYEGWRDILHFGGLRIKSGHIYSYIGNTRFAHPLLLSFYNSIFYRFIPFNLGYSFAFVCTKK